MSIEEQTTSALATRHASAFLSFFGPRLGSDPSQLLTTLSTALVDSYDALRPYLHRMNAEEVFVQVHGISLDLLKEDLPQLYDASTDRERFHWRITFDRLLLLFLLDRMKGRALFGNLQPMMAYFTFVCESIQTMDACQGRLADLTTWKAAGPSYEFNLVQYLN